MLVRFLQGAARVPLVVFEILLLGLVIGAPIGVGAPSVIQPNGQRTGNDTEHNQKEYLHANHPGRV